jgi:hypothetical protein
MDRTYVFLFIFNYCARSYEKSMKRSCRFMYFSSPKFEEGEDTEAKVICNRTLFFSPAVGFHYRIRNGTTYIDAGFF